MAGGVYFEENRVYQIDCSQAIWATDQVHSQYHAAGTFLCDADFIAETPDCIYIIEYKNANIPDASNPDGFKPAAQSKVDSVARKFYDSLHYLAINNKDKAVKYVYIVEYPNAGPTERKLLRNLIADRLPFKLQKGQTKPIIDSFDVVSIAEWNSHQDYSKFPLTTIIQGVST